MKRWMKKRNLWALLALVAVLAIGRTAIFGSKDAASARDAQQRIVSELITVSPATVVETAEYLGTLESENQALISPKVTADVVEKHVREGERVKTGETILQLDTRQLEAKRTTLEKKRATLATQIAFVDDQVQTFYGQNPVVSKIRSLEATLVFQKGELEKVESLYQVGATSASNRDQMAHQVDLLSLQLTELRNTAEMQYDALVQERAMLVHQLEELEASLAETTLAIDEAEIKAPFGGVVTSYHVNEGDLALPGKPLVTLSGVEDLKVTLSLSEGDLAKLELGAPATLTVAGEEHRGKVSKVAAMVNRQTRIGSAEVRFTEPASVQAPMGASVSVSLELDRHEETIFIPIDALKRLGDQTVVYVVGASGAVEERRVTTGAEVRQEVQITSGLSRGDRIAVRGVENLYDGAEIYTLDGEV